MDRLVFGLYKAAAASSKEDEKKLYEKDIETHPAVGALKGKLLGSLIGGALAAPSGYFIAKAKGVSSMDKKLTAALAGLGGMILGGLTGGGVGGYKAYKKRKELIEQGILSPDKKMSMSPAVAQALFI